MKYSKLNPSFFASIEKLRYVDDITIADGVSLNKAVKKLREEAKTKDEELGKIIKSFGGENYKINRADLSDEKWEELTKKLIELDNVSFDFSFDVIPISGKSKGLCPADIEQIENILIKVV